ncbi:ATP synthase subunit I [Pelotalea chapellei]|uniref:ATP synthase subunit I n=1 Tax=Pelotalea chapellei TaxID=44671 RepID=A0ABS5U9K5_9BACT|nr:ATP synthase subunit I [Pelotalea chapellei]MBT1072342.1 ATP synthase subunit I [Pelotalea chapellei]
MTAIDEESLFAFIVKGSILLLVVLTLIGFIFFSTPTGLGILAGGIVAIINFLWMRNVLQRILGLLPAKPQLYSQVRFIARISITGVVLYFIIVSGICSLAGLLVGLSIIVANIIALSLYCALRTGG